MMIKSARPWRSGIGLFAIAASLSLTEGAFSKPLMPLNQTKETCAAFAQSYNKHNATIYDQLQACQRSGPNVQYTVNSCEFGLRQTFAPANCFSIKDRWCRLLRSSSQEIPRCFELARSAELEDGDTAAETDPGRVEDTAVGIMMGALQRGATKNRLSSKMLAQASKKVIKEQRNALKELQNALAKHEEGGGHLEKLRPKVANQVALGQERLNEMRESGTSDFEAMQQEDERVRKLEEIERDQRFRKFQDQNTKQEEVAQNDKVEWASHCFQGSHQRQGYRCPDGTSWFENRCDFEVFGFLGAGTLSFRFGEGSCWSGDRPILCKYSSACVAHVEKRLGY